MPLIKTDFDGLLIFEPKVIEDDRGYFYESYNRRMYEDEGYQYEIMHVNECLRNGLKSSPVMTFEKSNQILMQCDDLRKQWGLKYPFE